MQRTSIPANVALLKLTPERLQYLRPTRSLDMFEGGSTSTFHEDGLFSVLTFGRPGSDERDRRFSYIDLKTTLLHPFYYKQLCRLKQLYAGIFSGREYAAWDETLEDFVPSDQVDGDTGFTFFMDYWDKIQFKTNDSDVRGLRIEFIVKGRERALLDKLLILPAGLRDVSVDESGRTKQGDINGPYRNILAANNALSVVSSTDNRLQNNTSYAMQQTFLEIYEYFNALVSGKGGFFLGKWGGRRIYNGTRNVITAMPIAKPVLGGRRGAGLNTTFIGLFQLAKSVLPKTIHMLQNGWIGRVFSQDGNVALVNPKTLRREIIRVSSSAIDKWTSTPGLEGVLNSYFSFQNRVKPIVVDRGYYLGLVYRGPDNTFKIFNDITELPVGNPKFDKKYVHPLTLTELLYISGYREWTKIPLVPTRYPITGLGSIYDSYAYVKTTEGAVARRELDDNWIPMDAEYTALEYPNMDEPVFYDAMSVHPSRLALAGGDHDGDTMSGNALYTDEAVEEVQRLLNKASSYVNPRGGLLASPSIESVQRVVMNYTGD